MDNVFLAKPVTTEELQAINEKVKELRMDIEEANKLLEELHEVRPELLNDRAKRLFEAIMKIADDRDKAYRMVDLMAEQLTTPVHNKQWVIDYFEGKVN